MQVSADADYLGPLAPETYLAIGSRIYRSTPSPHPSLQVGAEADYLGRCLRYMSHCEEPLVRIDRWQVGNLSYKLIRTRGIHTAFSHYTGARLPCLSVVYVDPHHLMLSPRVIKFESTPVGVSHPWATTCAEGSKRRRPRVRK